MEKNLKERKRLFRGEDISPELALSFPDLLFIQAAWRAVQFLVEDIFFQRVPGDLLRSRDCRAFLPQLDVHILSAYRDF